VLSTSHGATAVTQVCVSEQHITSLPAAGAPSAAPASVADDEAAEMDFDRCDAEDVESDFADGCWSGSDMDEEMDDSDEDVDARVVRRITRQVTHVARLTEQAAMDPVTGQRSKHRSLSVRSASRGRNENAPTVLTHADEAAIRKLLNEAPHAGKRAWFLSKTQLEQLPHWAEYQLQQQADPADAAGQAALKARLRKAQNGRTLWTSALQIAKDWDEYRHCCGSVHNVDRVMKQLLGMTVQARLQHSSSGVQAMMAKRIQKRASYPTKKDFTAAVCQELESSVIATVPGGVQSAASAQVAWDGGSVCHSCYRAVLGIGRTSLFKFKARLNLQANVRLLERAASEATRTQNPASKHFPHLIALAKKAADKPIYSPRSDSSTVLVKALLLAYCKAYGQHDPAGAGSKSLTKTTYVLPQHGVTALHSALNADLADRIATGRNQDLGPAVWLPDASPSGHPAVARAPMLISKSTLQRVIHHLDSRCDVRIQLAKQKGVCRCTHCDDLQASIKRTPLASVERQILEGMLASHLDTANEQRRHFDEKKAEAMKRPLDLWTITFDGFDKSKTAIPHRPRMSKEQELHANSLIGMHVVGVFAFGAPLPVMAFFNDESVAGGANLSATIVYEVLEKQWQKLVNDYRQQRYPGVDLESLQMSEEDRAEAHAYAASKWPRRLHLTFDNTSGEAKNTVFYKAMAALVHYGVFEAITMSMLLVGHTHDIVDQMFRYAHFATLAVLQTGLAHHVT
jgi:hypothetical protein